MGEPVVTSRDLTKTYKFHEQGAGFWSSLKSVFRRKYQTRLAVDAINLEVARGEVVGLLGPNGAGKTTTLKMLSGLLYTTSGDLQVLGHTPSERKPEYLKKIALVMGQKTMLWWDVPAMDTFLLHKEMYDIPDREFEASVQELAELLDVKDLLSVQVRKTSLGERMKLELMAALLHRPEVLFLDEPTIGLDVVAKARVRDFLAEVNRRLGTTIIITSHDMDDIEALCERVIIIDHGVIRYDGSLSELVHQIQPRKRIRATYAEPIQLPDDLETRFSAVREQDRVLRLEVERDETGVLLERLARLGAVVDLDVSDAPVDEIIRELFERAREDGGAGDQ